MGKTLTFWLPLLSCPYGIQTVVTPLNILGQQNVDTLSKFGVHGVFVSAKTASKKFLMCVMCLLSCQSFSFVIWQDVAHMKYQVMVVNPEELMRPEGGFQSLFKNQLFAHAIICIIIDEVHCVTHWGSFRPD